MRENERREIEGKLESEPSLSKSRSSVETANSNYLAKREKRREKKDTLKTQTEKFACWLNFPWIPASKLKFLSEPWQALFLYRSKQGEKKEKENPAVHFRGLYHHHHCRHRCGVSLNPLTRLCLSIFITQIQKGRRKKRKWEAKAGGRGRSGAVCVCALGE